MRRHEFSDVFIPAFSVSVITQGHKVPSRDCFFDRISNTFLKSLKVETLSERKERAILGQEILLQFVKILRLSSKKFWRIRKTRMRKKKCFFNLQSVEVGKLKFFRVLQILMLLFYSFFMLFLCLTSVLQKQKSYQIECCCKYS